MKRSIEKWEYMLDWADKVMYLTTWHLNDFVLVYADKFYPGPDTWDQARNSIKYYIGKMKKLGIVTNTVVLGLGPGGYFEFGCRTQTTYDIDKDALEIYLEVYNEKKTS